MSTLPRRIDAARKVEAELLGSLMRWPAEIADVRDRLSADDFHHDPHQRVYRAILRLHDRREPVDLVGVCEECRTAGDGMDSVYVAELWGAAGTGAAAGHQADRVLALSLERGLAHAAAEILGDVENPTGPVSELLNRAQAKLDALARRVPGTASVPLGAVVDRLLTEIDARCRGDRKCGVLTGFAEVDRTLAGGLPLGGLTVLAARPSVGKTSFAGHVARNVAGRGGAVYFASLEQPDLELAERLTAGDARVSGWRMRAGDLFPEHVRRVTESAGRTRAWRFEVNDRPGQSAGQIAAGARIARRKMKGLDLVVVDYLNLVRPENPKATRNEQTGASATRLRELARELGVPVLLLAQLNRESAHDSGAPRLHHLRDSGEVEQVADVVTFLHRAAPWEPGRPDQIELHVAKHRNGPLGVVRMEHESRVYTFREVVPSL